MLWARRPSVRATDINRSKMVSKRGFGKLQNDSDFQRVYTTTPVKNDADAIRRRLRDTKVYGRRRALVTTGSAAAAAAAAHREVVSLEKKNNNNKKGRLRAIG